MQVVLVYRNEEVNAEHLVSTRLLPRLDENALFIKLDRLTLPDVMDFVSDCLRKPVQVDASGKRSQVTREDANLRGLAELVLQRTAGSPMFVAQVTLPFPNPFSFSFPPP